MSKTTWNGLYNICWRNGKIESGFYTINRALESIKDDYPNAHEVRIVGYSKVYESRAAQLAEDKPIAQIMPMDKDPI